MRRTIETARLAVGGVCLAAVLSVLWLLLWVTAIPLVTGWSPVVVLSGSMTPGIGVGDVVLAADTPVDRLGPGSVIVFDNGSDGGLVTHRIVAVEESGDFVTRGDANLRADSTRVPPSRVHGAGRILVPVIGTPLVWFEHSQWMFLLLAAAVLVVAMWGCRWMLSPAAIAARPRQDRGARLAKAVRSKRTTAPLSIAVAFVVLAGMTNDSGAAFGDPTSTVGNSFSLDEWKRILDIDGGLAHACLVRSEGYVWCWGGNDKGQLGDNTTTDHWTPVAVTGSGGVGALTTTIALSAGNKFTCALKKDGSVRCWGENTNGQLGDNTTTDRPAAVQVKGPGGSGTLTGVVGVAAGDSFSCAVRSDGSVWCWGRNDRGQLGNNTTSDERTPVQVKGAGGVGTLSGVVSVTAGAKFACAVKSDGTVWCWGENANGQLGDNTKSQSLIPVQVKGPGGSGTLTGVASAVAGEGFVCAVKTSGSVWCWGRNDQGQLGNDTTGDELTPVQVKGPGGIGTLAGVVDLGAGQKHACGVKSDGTVWCWGINNNGQLGDNTSTRSLTPVQVKGSGGAGTLGTAVLVGVGELFSCAALSDYTAWCWGRNDRGQLGDNTTTDRPAPVQVKGGGWKGAFDAVGVAGGDLFSCAVRSDGSVWCWGRNDKGQLGNNTTSDQLTPTQVKGAGGVGTLSGVVSVTAGAKFACAVKSDGTVWCWGDNPNGQLGDNTKSQSSVPVQVKGSGGSGTLTGVAGAAAGESFVCAVKTGGSVWCWGRNDQGQLGYDTTGDELTPVQVKGPGGIGTLAGVVDLGAGQKHACGVKSDGTVWCWGINNNGELGDNTSTRSLTPVQVKGPGGVGTLGTAVVVELGLEHSCVVKSDGSVWCWGRNDRGQVGDNTTADRPAPVQVKGVGGTGTLAGIGSVDGGDKHSCAKGVTGGLWCWGENNKGQLGDDSSTNRSVPVAVVGPAGTGTIGDAIGVTGGSAHSCAVRADNSTWCWGDNLNGQLGNGTIIGSSRPVQVL